MKYSKKVTNLQPSATIALSDNIKELQNKGLQIIQLAGGQPYFPTPINIKLAAIKALENNETYYSHSRGIAPLRTALTNSYNKKYNTQLDPHKNILITPGGKQALLYALFTIINPGNEVIIPMPSWMSYEEMIKIADGTPIFVNSNKNNNFDISFDAIAQAITTKTKAIIINSPNNPTGRMTKKETLQAIYALCLKNDIVLICDEVYDHITFDIKHDSILSVSPSLKNCILINSLSKTYAMTGWRLGYALAEQETIDAMVKLQQNSATCPTTFAQFGAIEAIQNGQNFIKESLEFYTENKNYLIHEFKTLKNFNYIAPQGGLFLFIDVSKIHLNSTEFCFELLNQCNIAAIPGIAFGKTGESFIRINMATEKKYLETFIQKLRNNYETKTSHQASF